jgi:hypothetical protein
MDLIPNVTAIGQGDVTLLYVGPPTDIDRQPEERIVLAQGETTMHQHEFSRAIRLVEDGKTFLLVQETGFMEVKDANGGNSMAWRHDPIEVPPGKYLLIDGQREYNPERIRRVQD